MLRSGKSGRARCPSQAPTVGLSGRESAGRGTSYPEPDDAPRAAPPARAGAESALHRAGPDDTTSLLAPWPGGASMRAGGSWLTGLCCLVLCGCAGSHRRLDLHAASQAEVNAVTDAQLRIMRPGRQPGDLDSASTTLPARASPAPRP